MISHSHKRWKAGILSNLISHFKGSYILCMIFLFVLIDSFNETADKYF